MKVTFKYEDITYIAYVNSLGMYIVEGTLYQKTDRKIFRKKFIDSFSFIITDYDSIIDGIEHAIVKTEEKQAEKVDVCGKWAEFYKEAKRRNKDATD